jgi:hypothetical protein
VLLQRWAVRAGVSCVLARSSVIWNAVCVCVCVCVCVVSCAFVRVLSAHVNVWYMPPSPIGIRTLESMPCLQLLCLKRQWRPSRHSRTLLSSPQPTGADRGRRGGEERRSSDGCVQGDGGAVP